MVIFKFYCSSECSNKREKEFIVFGRGVFFTYMREHFVLILNTVQRRNLKFFLRTLLVLYGIFLLVADHVFDAFNQLISYMTSFSPFHSVKLVKLNRFISFLNYTIPCPFRFSSFVSTPVPSNPITLMIGLLHFIKIDQSVTLL